MKRTNTQGWFARADSTFLFNAAGALLLLSLVLFPVGCGQFNDYVVAPTIVDASERPPYITSPVEVPKNEPIPIYPLLRQSSESAKVARNEYSNSPVTVTAVEPDKPLTASADQDRSATKNRRRRILYEYAPNHPGANDQGYIEIINPDYADKSIKRPIEVNQSRESLAVRSGSAVTSPDPMGEEPKVTEVTVTASDSQAVGMPEVEVVDFDVAPVQDPSLQTAMTVQVPQVGVKKDLKNIDQFLTPTVSVNSSDGLRKVIDSPQPHVEPVMAKTSPKPFPIENTHSTIEALQQLVRENPDDTQKQVSLRFLYLAYGKKEEALELFPSVPVAKQAEAINIVRAAMLTAQASAGEDGTGTASRALEALKVLSESMANHTDLEVAHLEICQDQSVKGFGQYEPLAKNLLASGEPRTVQIYCELKHFKSQLNASGKYVTRIAASIELVDEDYRTIYQLPKSEIPDAPSYHPRRDFFFRGQIKLPRLAPGKYEFVVKAEDKFAGKTARPFRKPFEVKPAKRDMN